MAKWTIPCVLLLMCLLLLVPDQGRTIVANAESKYDALRLEKKFGGLPRGWSTDTDFLLREAEAMSRPRQKDILNIISLLENNEFFTELLLKIVRYFISRPPIAIWPPIIDPFSGDEDAVLGELLGGVDINKLPPSIARQLRQSRANITAAFGSAVPLLLWLIPSPSGSLVGANYSEVIQVLKEGDDALLKILGSADFDQVPPEAARKMIASRGWISTLVGAAVAIVTWLVPSPWGRSNEPEDLVARINSLVKANLQSYPCTKL